MRREHIGLVKSRWYNGGLRRHRVQFVRVSGLNKKIYATSTPYVFLDGIVFKRSWAGEARNVSLHT